MINLQDKEAVVGALMALYHCQTIDEQAVGTTVQANGMGFNALDANILSSFAEQYLRKEWLSDKQIALAQNKLKKYQGQLERLNVQPLPIKSPAAKKPISRKVQKWGEGDLVLVMFPYNPNLVREVKLFRGRQWNPDQKGWLVPFNKNANEILPWLEKHGFQWEGEAPKAPKPADTKKAVQEKIQTPLFPFQQDGVDFIEQTNGKALVGDEMGLGKTIQAISYLAIHPELRPALIVVPASLKLNWAREFAKHAGIKTALLSGKKNPIQEGSPKAEIHIINYDVVDAWAERLAHEGYKAMVLDECHYIKNRQAKRTKAVQDLARKIGKVLALSGTPITNRPAEFFTVLNLVAPDQFRGFRKFGDRYCGPETVRTPRGYVTVYNGATNLDELVELLKPVMIRRKKADVLKQLPPKTRTVVPVDMELDAAAQYSKAREDIIQWLKSEGQNGKAAKASKAEQLARFSYLKQLAAEGKAKAVVEWVQDFLDSGKKLVVFATHTKMVERLMKEFGSVAVKLTGEDDQEARQRAVERFQNDETIRLFVGNLQAAGVGITLTAADSTAFVELGWTPGEHVQAEDRVHRIGQESENVCAYYLVAQNTIEEEIALMIDKKRRVLDKLLDGEETPDDDLLSALINNLKGI